MHTLYLHIGTSKTGTTALQMFFTDNQDVLRKKGYDYPLHPYRFPFVSQRRNGHFLVGAVRDENGKHLKKEEQKVLKDGLDMILASFEQYDNVILSEETIWKTTALSRPEMFPMLKEHADKHGYQIKVIVYLRRQDGMASSWYRQLIKTARTDWASVSWEEYTKDFGNFVLGYYEHLEDIAAVIGRDNIVVRVYDRGKFEGNGNTIFSDFLKCVGLEFNEEFVIAQQEMNWSLSLNLSEIKRKIHKLPDYDAATRLFVEKVSRGSAAVGDSTPGQDFMSKEEVEEFMSNYAEGNRKIAQEYMHLDADTPFDMDLKDVVKWTPDNPQMLEDVIHFFGEAMLMQQKQMDEYKTEVAQLKKRLEKQENRMSKLLDAFRHPFRAFKYVLKK